MAASPSLPLECISEILIKLPVKPLHRFKCVSKSWNFLISSSNFIKLHLTKTLEHSTTNSNKIIVTNNNSILSSVISDNKLRFDIVTHPLNNLPDRPPVELIESVNGVLLIADFPKKTVFLTNPSNKTHRLVPPAPSREPAFAFGLVEVFGFGYDDVTDDYKVVRLIQWFDEGSGLCREASVYSLRNDSWVSVYDETVSYSLQRTNAIAIDQTLLFVVISSNSKLLLKCFDLRTSMFSLIDHPVLDSNDYGKMTMSLRNLRGCLCLVVNYQKHKVDPSKYSGDPLYNRVFLYADIWEMKEGLLRKDCKWVKLFRIRKNEIHKNCMYLRLVTYSNDEKSVLLEVDGVWFGWYDLVTKKIRRVSVQGLRLEDSPHVAFTYVDSLVSVKNDKVVSKKKGALARKKAIDKEDFLSSGFKIKL